MQTTYEIDVDAIGANGEITRLPLRITKTRGEPGFDLQIGRGTTVTVDLDGHDNLLELLAGIR